jgi:pyridoxal biosynthesis lyase PdxS
VEAADFIAAAVVPGEAADAGESVLAGLDGVFVGEGLGKSRRGEEGEGD